MIKRTISLLLFLLLSCSFVATAQQVPTPRSVLGFDTGEDRKLADWAQITDYFKKLDAASARVELRELGQSTLKRPFFVAFLSSEENLKNLGRIRENQRKLADPRLIADAAERDRLIRETPAVVAITCSIHSTEVVAAQMSMELAYRLASEQSKATQQILDNVVLILVPSVNPDGIDIVNHWYHKTLGTRYEGTSPPELYHHYTGHDNNRDWFMLTQVETQLLSKLFWQEWFPEIVYDVHQQGANGSRMCVPPFFDPHNPNIDPLIVRQTGTIGMRMATKLQAAGFKGIVTNSTYDMWWHGGLRSAPYYHNAIGILTEAASARLGTPVEISREQLRSQTRGLANPLVPATNFPEPWEGGWWRMRDIQDMELITTRTVLEEATLHREELLRNFVTVANRAIEAGMNEAPYAYVIPAEQHDESNALKMLDILMQQGIEVHRTKSEYMIHDTKYRAGGYVVKLAQPYRANVKCLFEPQQYPERRLYPGGPAEPPYDVAGWTLPMQMGVNYIAIDKNIDIQLEKVTRDDVGLVNPQKTPYQSAASNDTYAKVNEAKDPALKVSIWRTKEEVIIENRKLPAGTFIFRESLKPEAKKAKRKSRSVTSKKAAVPNQQPDVAKVAEPFTHPRLALYKPWSSSMDEGWTRWVLEQYKFEYKSLYDKEVRGGNLREKFDVIILPDMNANQIIQGGRPGSLPDEYTGGIGDEGVAALRAFVEAGGVLVCFDSSSELAMQRFDLPVKNALANLGSDQFYAPGSLFRAHIDTRHPVGYGMPEEADLYFVAGRRGAPADESAPEAGRSAAPRVRALAFEVTDPQRVRVVARYAEGNPLRSGWLLGPHHIAGKNALVDVSLGKGRVILFGFRPQHRGQTWGTFKLIFNSILLGKRV